jgi:hypothetical protein
MNLLMTPPDGEVSFIHDIILMIILILQFNAVPFLSQVLAVNPRSQTLAHRNNIALQSVV